VSAAATQARKFYEQVAAERRVFTFLADGSFLVFPVSGAEVVPFWSSLSRLRRMRELHPKYRAYEADEIPLAEFLERTLPQLEGERIRVGVNWSGERLTGHDLSVGDLRRNLDYCLAKRSG
jgi:Protein of unknown function (DUF2750)